jgi:hypothetical protein
VRAIEISGTVSVLERPSMKACAGFIVGGVSIAQIESGEGKHLQREHLNLSEECSEGKGIYCPRRVQCNFTASSRKSGLTGARLWVGILGICQLLIPQLIPDAAP